MSFLTQAFAVVISPSGSAIYHIITLFAVEAAFAIAVGQLRWSGLGSGAGRFAVAAGLAGAGRFLLYVLGSLGVAGVFAAPAILPPLDRAVALATILLIGWACISRSNSRLPDVLLAASLMAIAILYVVMAVQWYPLGASGLPYNDYDAAWEYAKLAALFTLVVALLLRRPADSGLTLGILLTLLIGTLFHLVSPNPAESYAASERIAELAAIPLFAVIVYRTAMASAATPATDGATQSPAQFNTATRSSPTVPSSTRVAVTPQAAVALASLAAASDNFNVVTKIGEAVSKTLLADIALVFSPPRSDGVLSCVGGYDLIREHSLEGFTLSTRRVNTIASAISRGRPARLRITAHGSELLYLGDALGVGQYGPAILVPLTLGEQNYGAIIAMSAYSQKEWTNDDHSLLAALATPVAQALNTIENTSQQLNDLQVQLESSNRRLQAAEANARSAQHKADRLVLDIEEAREQARRLQRKADSLAAIIQAEPVEEEQPKDYSAEIESLQSSYRSALDELAELNRQLTEAQAERDRARDQLTETQRHMREQAERLEMQALTLASADQAAIPQTVSPFDSSASEDLNRTLNELSAVRHQLSLAKEEIDQLRLQLAESTAVTTSLPAVGDDAHTRELETISQKYAEALTELESLQAQLAAKPAGTGESAPAQSSMFISLVQDLRQPMSSIVGYTDLLLGESVGILGALQRNFLERIKANTERLTNILDDLIRVSAIDSGTLTLDQQHLDVIDAIEGAFSSVGAQFREKGISLRMDIADDLPPIEADRDAVQQIIARLLSNACAASQPNSEVIVAARPEASAYLVVSVRDTGGGIAPGDQSKVFTRLQLRADRPLIQGLGETGVGLSIAKVLTEAQGGRIWVDSDMGLGSTFSVILPVPANGRS